jgi:hypothetical protein
MVIPYSGNANTFNLVLNQNYFTASGLSVSVRSDTLATLATPLPITAGGIYQWTLLCSLSGNGRGNGSLIANYTITVGGYSYSGTAQSNVNPYAEPTIQLSLGVQFGGTIGSTDYYQTNLSQFELQQQK